MLKYTMLNIPLPKSIEHQIEFDIIELSDLLKLASWENLETPHRLDFNLIMIVIEGKGIQYIDFKSYEYSKGTIFFVKKHQALLFEMNSNLECFFLEVTDKFLNKLTKNIIYDIFDYTKYPVNMQLSGSYFNDILTNINLLIQQLKIPVDDFKELILQSHLKSLLLQLTRKRVLESLPSSTKEQKLYSDFIHLVHNSHTYSDQVKDYAKKLNVSVRTLSNLLHKFADKSTKVYLDEFLILEIKRYLLDDRLTLQEISNHLHFDEPTNLVKFFKRLENQTPNEFRTKVRKTSVLSI